MGVKIPAELHDLLEGPVVINLATITADGFAQVHPVWCAWDGETITVNSAKGRAKDRNMRERPKVTVLAVDPSNPYRWIEIRGEVVEVSEEGADAVIDDLAELYINQRPYPFRKEGEVRVNYRIRPLRYNVMH